MILFKNEILIYAELKGKETNKLKTEKYMANNYPSSLDKKVKILNFFKNNN